jgi:aromatic ring hydroxylase
MGRKTAFFFQQAFKCTDQQERIRAFRLAWDIYILERFGALGTGKG